MRLADWELPIEGDNIALTPLVVEDLAEMQEWLPAIDPLDLLWSVPPLEDEALSTWIEEQHRQNRALWAIYAPEFAGAPPDQWVLVGRLTLMQIDDHARSARLGLVIGPQYAESTAATEALTLFLDAYFDSAEYKLIRVTVPAIYPRQQSLYESLGFVIKSETCLPAGINAQDDDALAFLQNDSYAWARPLFAKSDGRNTVLAYDMTLTAERWHALEN